MFDLGNLLWRRGDISAAIPEFEEAINLTPNRALPLWSLANVYESQELWKEAEALYERAVTVDHLETRQVNLAGFTPHPDQEWMEQQGRNITMEEWGCLKGCRDLLHDRDAKFCQSFRELIKTGSVNPLRLPTRSPNLNSYAERWVRSVKEECLSRLIVFGESSLRRALQQYIVHYHEERNHQGKDNRILFPSRPEARRNMGAVRCRERLGGLLKYYEREAA